MTLPASEPSSLQVRTYDEALLTQLDPSSLEFSRTWSRSLLRDRPEIDSGGVPTGAGQPLRGRGATWPEFSRTDAELEAALRLDAVTDEAGTVYYRPHFTAARLYLGDPDLWQSRSVDGTSEKRRDAWEIVRAWLAQGRGLDALIPVDPLPPFGEEEEPVDTVATEDTGPYIPNTPLVVSGL